jgi:acyl dehydratase
MDLKTLKVGDSLPTHEVGPISRFVLALYAGGSGDHNPMHVDSDFAKAGGMPDVFAHGMLSMAYLAQLLTAHVKPEQIRSYGVRFASITPVNARLTCKGTVIETFQVDGEHRLKLQLQTVSNAGAVTLQGDAVVAV